MVLCAKRQAFVEAYICWRNGAVGAHQADYAPGSAKKEAWRLLRDPEIRSAVREAFEARAMETAEYLGAVAEIVREEWGLTLR